ncbi:MAG: acyl-CoA/acyl-ACP dehydrogenase [Pirellulaceae bacterium]|nr:acyl-CoA/acyl-ACP dehydrogenase [Pirellulaceae bacterium]
MELSTLCKRLAANPLPAARSSDSHDDHASLKLRLSWCAETGVFRWFVPKQYGGWQWSDVEQIEGYLALSQACLTTAFVVTQWNAACKRMVLSSNEALKQRWLPAMASGDVLATVGISHLTTSRQHVQSPVLKAVPDGQDGWKLNGMSPWVTGGSVAQVIVVGATLPDGRQLLCAVPSDRQGLQPGPGAPLMALSASLTDAVQFQDVSVRPEDWIAGPAENIMHSGAGGGAGGLQTSTLAIGLTQAAVEFLQAEAERRPDLQRLANKLSQDANQLRQVLLALATGETSVSIAPPGDGGVVLDGTVGITDWSAARLREHANSLVLRATQVALGAAKGAGFVEGHAAGRWCREALFFLVWSCPQPVLAANLCEFAQL